MKMRLGIAGLFSLSLTIAAGLAHAESPYAVAAVGTGQVTVFNWKTDTVLTNLAIPNPSDPILDPNGKWIYVLGWTNVSNGNSTSRQADLYVIDSSTFKITQVVKLQLDAAIPDSNSMAVSRDGRFIYINEGGVIEVVCGIAHVVLKTIQLVAPSDQVSGSASQVFVSPDGKFLFVSFETAENQGFGGLTVLSTSTWQTVGSPLSGASVAAYSLSPDGTTLVQVTPAGGEGEEIAAVSLQKQQNLWTWPTVHMQAVAIAPNSKTGYVDADGALYVLDLATGQVTDMLFVNPETDYPVLFSGDGSTAYMSEPSFTISSDAVIIALDTATDNVSNDYQVPPLFRAAALTPDGSQLWATGPSSTPNSSEILVLSPSSRDVITTITVGGGTSGGTAGNPYWALGKVVFLP